MNTDPTFLENHCAFCEHELTTIILADGEKVHFTHQDFLREGDICICQHCFGMHQMTKNDRGNLFHNPVDYRKYIMAGGYRYLKSLKRH